jgi:dephospho-CoA kinase
VGRVGGVPFLGLTGGIGAGKSTALAALARLGAVTLSTDAVVHELYESDRVRAAVVARFGDDVAPEGAIDRGTLAERAFATDAGRAWLEQLIWPLVGTRIAEFRQASACLEPPPRAAVVEVPLLFEAGLDGIYDATIAVVAGEDVRRERALARGHEALDERDARQLPQDEKARRASYVVRNDGSVEELEAQLSAVLVKLSR